MKTKISILIILLSISTIFSQRATRFDGGIKLQNATEETDFSTYNRIPLMRSNGKINNYIHSDSIVLQSQIKSFISLSNASDFVLKSGDNMTGGLVIDKSLTTTNIADSELTVKKSSVNTGTNVNSFFDVNRNHTADGVSETYGLISRVTNISSFNDEGITGANNVARHTGSGDLTYSYGTTSTTEHAGSGDITFLVSSNNRVLVTGAGAATVEYARGNSITLENPNATIQFAQNHHPSLMINGSTLVNGHIMYLDADYTSGSITGEFAYLRSGFDTDVMAELAGNTNAYYIKSDINLPSELLGSFESNGLSSTGTLGVSGLATFDTLAYSGASVAEIHGTTDDVLVNKKWVVSNTISRIKVEVVNPVLDGSFSTDLIPAQGVNKVIIVKEITMMSDVTSAYSDDFNFSFNITNFSNIFSGMSASFINKTIHQGTTSADSGSGISFSSLDNQPLNISSTVNAVTQGVGTFTFFITYEVLDLN